MLNLFLNLNGEKEKIEATERYIKDESDRELFLGEIYRTIFGDCYFMSISIQTLRAICGNISKRKKNVWVYKSYYVLR